MSTVKRCRFQNVIRFVSREKFHGAVALRPHTLHIAQLLRHSCGKTPQRAKHSELHAISLSARMLEHARHALSRLAANEVTTISRTRSQCTLADRVMIIGATLLLLAP
jgi:hypothetical protein